MATATWPLTIPQKLSPDGFSFKPGKNTLRTSMTTGPPKSRRLGTSAPWELKGNMEMTSAEYSTWETFYVDTLKDGEEPFDWLHPISGDSREFQYMNEPEVTPAGGGNWNVYMEMEMLVT